MSAKKLQITDCTREKKLPRCEKLPVEDVLGRHFEEGDEGVDYPVGQPLLVVQLGRALHRADRRVPDPTSTSCAYTLVTPLLKKNIEQAAWALIIVHLQRVY